MRFFYLFRSFLIICFLAILSSTHPVAVDAIVVDGVYNPGSDNVATIQFIEPVFANILSITLQIIGYASFTMIVFGGIKYLLSGGDPKATEAASRIITYAIAGVALAILAWFLLFFISQFVDNQDILIFSVNIP